MHRDQALRGRADHRPALPYEQAGKRCGVGHAQPCVQRERRQWRGKSGFPAAREVHLEHIAGAQVVDHPLHARGEALRRILAPLHRRLPLRQRFLRWQPGQILLQALQQRLPPGGDPA
jgi:hypothetical protein